MWRATTPYVNMLPLQALLWWRVRVLPFQTMNTQITSKGPSSSHFFFSFSVLFIVVDLFARASTKFPCRQLHVSNTWNKQEIVLLARRLFLCNIFYFGLLLADGSPLRTLLLSNLSCQIWHSEFWQS